MRSMVTGTIKFRRTDAENGNFVTVTGPGGMVWDALHLSGFYYRIVEGDPVHAGDIIGYCGHTGTNRGDHVHWRVGLENAAGGDLDCPEEFAGIDLVDPLSLHSTNCQ